MQEAMIIWLQTHLHPTWDPFFEIVTFFGGVRDGGIILVWACVVWSLSYAAGCRLLILAFCSGYCVNLWLKAAVALPRPFEVSTQVIPIITEKGYAFPSGHALNSMIAFGFVAWLVRKPIVTWCCAAMIFLIGLSRVALGVHYPMDIVASWAIGGGFLWGFARWHTAVERIVGRWHLGGKLLAIILPAAIGAGLLEWLGPAGIPLPWKLIVLFLYSGAAIGWLLKSYFLAFDATGPLWQRTARFLLGVGVLFPILHYFPKALWIHLFAGFWFTLGAPALFRCVGLADRR